MLQICPLKPATRGFQLCFAHSTRTISAEGCARSRQIALSPAFRALDAHDLRRGLHFRLTLFVPHSAFKREFIKRGNVFFIRTSPVLVFHTHTCLLIACLHSHCMLAYSPLHIMLAYLHLHILTLAYFALGCFRSSSVRVCVCNPWNQREP